MIHRHKLLRMSQVTNFTKKLANKVMKVRIRHFTRTFFRFFPEIMKIMPIHVKFRSQSLAKWAKLRCKLYFPPPPITCMVNCTICSSGRVLSFKTFFMWILISIYQGAAIMYLAILLFKEGYTRLISCFKRFPFKDSKI